MPAIRNCSGKMPRYQITSILAEGARQVSSCRHAVQVVGGPPPRRLKSLESRSNNKRQIRPDGLVSFEQGLGPALLFRGHVVGAPRPCDYSATTACKPEDETHAAPDLSLVVRPRFQR